MRTNLIEEIKQEAKVNVSTKQKSKKGKDVTIHLIHILDGSGSMAGSRFIAAKEGMDEEINAIKKETDGIKYTYTVVEFDYNTHIVTAIDKADVNKITLKDIELFAPDGMTALYDAIGHTLSNFVCNKGDKVIVKIFTDGSENNSKKFRGNDIKELISSKEKERWVITFVGTPQDIENNIRNIGISQNNTLSYDGTAQGLRHSYTVSNTARTIYAKAVLEGNEESMTLNFFGNYNK